MMDRSAVHDDRILPLTRWVLLCVIPFLVVAFGMLYFFPNDTDKLFAWTIKPAMTPMLMGAGYIAGAYFFFRTFFSKHWHHVHMGFLPVTIFATTMLIATLLHWDRFNHNHISFYAWILLYATTPFIVFYLWWHNRSADPGTPDPVDAIIPMPVRMFMGIVGAGILLTGILLFIFPDFMISIWPWMLTPLTARVIGGWFALPGVFGLAIANDRRWSSARYALQSQALGILLILIGVIRAWDNFNPANPLSLVFAGGMVLLVVAIVALYMVMEGRVSKAAAVAT